MMKMKFKLFLRFVTLAVVCMQCAVAHGQLVFEINEPMHLKGVYPGMIPKNDWTGVADVSSNFYSDTIVVANDGIAGSACGTLQTNLSGNFAVFRRNSCSFDQQLLNVQNAGATGAIIIDSTVGRPLPFDAFGLSNQITIPFMVVSKDEGDSLIYATQQGEICQVSFGSKKDVFSNDIGIYKEKALWSSYGYYRLYNGDHFTDTTVGTWVFNNGTTNATNLQLKFFIQGQLSGIYDEVISAPFDLNSHDSVFIELPYLATTMDYSNETSGVDYGYEIIGSLNDNDTLDNRISMALYFKTIDISLGYLYDVCSPSYFNFDSGNDEDDYVFGDEGYAEYDLCLNFYREFPTCIFSADVKSGFGAYFSLLLNFDNYVPDSVMFFDSLNSLSIAYSYYNSFYQNQSSFMNFNEIVDITEVKNMGVYFENLVSNVYFTTDMYHDERYRQYPDKRPILFENYVFKPILSSLTPCMFFLQPARNSVASCFIGLSENEQSVVNVYPNPSNGKITIECSKELKSIRVFSPERKQVFMSSDFSGTTFELNLDQLQKGMYSIAFQTEDGNSFSQKLIIQ